MIQAVFKHATVFKFVSERNHEVMAALLGVLLEDKEMFCTDVEPRGFHVMNMICGSFRRDEQAERQEEDKEKDIEPVVH